jgi:hypothetical protein
MQEPIEEVAHWLPKPPLIEVRKADDVAGGGFGSSSLLGIIHSGYVAFITGQRSQSLTSRDAILLVKLERPHGSIKRSEKALHRWRWQWLQGQFSIYLSLSLFLSLACRGRWETQARGGQKADVCKGREKPLG